MVKTENSYGDRVSRLVSWGHWFALFNIILALLIGIRFLTQSPWPDTFLGQGYLFVSWLGHFSFLVFGLYILLLFPLTFAIPSQKIFRIFSVALATIGLTLLLLDTQAFHKLHLHLNPVLWELLLSKEKTEFNAKWQHLFTLVPILFILELVASELAWRKQRKLSRKKIGKPIAAFFFLCFVISHLTYVWADANFYTPVTAQRSTFPLSYPMTAKRFMEKHGLLDREAYQQRLENGDGNADFLQYPLEDLDFKGLGTNQNLLVIMVDNLRSDMVSPKIMPTSYYFAKTNQNFENHYSSSNNDDGNIGLFYGLPTHYAASLEKQNEIPLFLSIMQDRNYQMSVYSENDFEDTGIYASTFKALDIVPNQKIVTEEGKRALLSKTSENTNLLTNWKNWLKQAQLKDKPWVSYVELADADQYEAEQDIAPQFKPKKQDAPSKLKASYQTAAWKVDQKIKQILDTLEISHLMEHTVVVITSNHGIEFNESGSNSWGFGSNFSRYQLQVPMIIHWPGKPAQSYSYPTSHLDFSATIMQDILESTSNPKDYGSGKNLFNAQKRPWILSGDRENIALITPQNTIVVDDFGNYKVYDENYHKDKKAKPRLSIVMQGLSELKRFYDND